MPPNLVSKANWWWNAFTFELCSPHSQSQVSSKSFLWVMWVLIHFVPMVGLSSEKCPIVLLSKDKACQEKIITLWTWNVHKKTVSVTHSSKERLIVRFQKLECKGITSNACSKHCFIKHVNICCHQIFCFFRCSFLNNLESSRKIF